MAKIPVILEPGRADGKLAESKAIYDSILEQFQSDINGEYKLTKEQVEFLMPIVERLNDVQDTLTSIDVDKPLSAQQGKLLKQLLDSKVIEVGAVPMDSEPIEGNTGNIVTSDGVYRAINKKVDKTTFNEINARQDLQINIIENQIYDENDDTYVYKIVDAQGKGLISIDKTGNIHLYNNCIIEGFILGDMQKALPEDFVYKIDYAYNKAEDSYITSNNNNFIYSIVDGEGKLLFGIGVDGNVYISKLESAEINEIKTLIKSLKSTQNITPEMFGAVADGVTDCSDALQNMFDYMKANNIRTAHFEKGKYLISKRIYIIDFPCTIVGPDAWIVTTLNMTSGKNFRNAFRFMQTDPSVDMGITDVQLNFETHCIPIGVFGYRNFNLHDCTLKTVVGTSLPFAFCAYNLKNSSFNNIHIDQYRADYGCNSADGLHFLGNCNDISITNCYGISGDDFIALNATEGIDKNAEDADCEGSGGPIYNVYINNCTIGSETQKTATGIRIYGNKNSYIKNITVDSCRIYPEEGPAIFITNYVTPYANRSSEATELFLSNLCITNCELYCPKYNIYDNGQWYIVGSNGGSAITIAGTTANNVFIYNCIIKSNDIAEQSYMIECIMYNHISDISICNCTLLGDKFKDILYAHSYYESTAERIPAFIGGITMRDSHIRDSKNSPFVTTEYDADCIIINNCEIKTQNENYRPIVLSNHTGEPTANVKYKEYTYFNGTIYIKG